MSTLIYTRARACARGDGSLPLLARPPPSALGPPTSRAHTAATLQLITIEPASPPRGTGQALGARPFRALGRAPQNHPISRTFPAKARRRALLWARSSRPAPPGEAGPSTLWRGARAWSPADGAPRRSRGVVREAHRRAGGEWETHENWCGCASTSRRTTRELRGTRPWPGRNPQASHLLAAQKYSSARS
jgi:hypothetical protein